MAPHHVRSESEYAKNVFENETVKMYELRLGPRQEAEMHSHPDYVGYLLTDARLRIKYADGVGEDRDYKAGQAAYRKAQKHSIENVGDSEARILITEFKSSQPA